MIIANSALNAPRWLSIISYPTHARGIIVNYSIIKINAAYVQCTVKLVNKELACKTDCASAKSENKFKLMLRKRLLFDHDRPNNNKE